MKPWRSSSITLLTAFLFGYVATYNAARLCNKWKSNTNLRFLAMGIITDASGQSRFYAVSSEFEGLTVPADHLYIPRDPNGNEQPAQPDGSPSHPTINLTDAETLDLTSSQASWPQGEANGKGAFILAFQPAAGFHSGEKFLAFISAHSHELLLASLTNPDVGVKRAPISGDYAPPSRTVFSTDNRLAAASDASVLATVRFLNAEETGTADCNLRRNQEDILRFESLHIAPPSMLKPSLAIDGGFLLNGNRYTDARLFALSNSQRKIYLFYPGNVEPTEVPFADFLLCPEGGLTPLKAAGIAVPVILIIGAVGFYMAYNKTKADAPPPTVSRTNTVSDTSTAGSTAGKSKINPPLGKPGQLARSPLWVAGSPSSGTSSLPKFKISTSGKPGTPSKKPGTPSKKSTT